MKTYRGLPDPPTIAVSDPSGVRTLKPKNEEIGFAWGTTAAVPGGLGPNVSEERAKEIRDLQAKHAGGTNQTALAIAADVLGSEEEAVKVYQRLKHRTVLKWPSDQAWVLTEADLRKHLADIETIERETEYIRQSHHMREVVNEGGGGIVWDTDIDGRRRGPR